MWLSRWKAIAGLFLAAILSTPVWAANPALPGTLNYVEGQATLGNQTVNSKSVGSADLQSGQALNTTNGRSEVLLTPGVFLRLDNNSSVKMVSPSLTNTEVQLDKGRAMVEVAEIHKQNDIKVDVDGTSTRLDKKGLYEFDANQPGDVRVFDGKATVLDNDKKITVKGGHEFAFNDNPKLKTESFNKKKDEDDFYNWNSLRSQYLAEANVNAATYYMNGFAGPGWYWDPWFSMYTFIPGTGYMYSPFGWGFYSPAWVYAAPVYYGYYGYGPRAYVPRYRVGPTVRPAYPRAEGMHAMHIGAPAHFGVYHGGFGGPGFHGGGGFHR